MRLNPLQHTHLVQCPSLSYFFNESKKEKQVSFFIVLFNESKKEKQYFHMTPTSSIDFLVLVYCSKVSMCNGALHMRQGRANNCILNCFIGRISQQISPLLPCEKGFSHPAGLGSKGRPASRPNGALGRGLVRSLLCSILIYNDYIFHYVHGPYQLSLPTDVFFARPLHMRFAKFSSIIKKFLTPRTFRN